MTLPEGMSANPAAAGGLQACSATQFGLGSTVEPAEPADCPTSSQIGTVEVCTPLLANRTGKVENGEQVDRECEEGKAVPVLQGQVFVGAPECSPCSASDVEAGKLFRLFLQVRAPERGVIVKLAGKVSANPLTGRLQATFAKQPQVPFGELRMKLEGGTARAARDAAELRHRADLDGDHAVERPWRRRRVRRRTDRGHARRDALCLV